MLPVSRASARKARGTLVWGLAAFLALQAACIVLLEGPCPRVYDAEYATRLELLRGLRRREPDRPLLLLLGSSRTMLAFKPEILPPLPAVGGARPLPFNFSHVGAGPVFNLMMLHRVLGHGFRPRWLVVELMPAYLAHDGDNFLMTFMGAGDLALLRQYEGTFRLYWKYWWQRRFLGRAYQAEFLRSRFPSLDLPGGSFLSFTLDQLGGNSSPFNAVPPAEVSRRTLVAQNQYLEILQNFHITPTADRAIGELVDLCRREGIHLAFLVTPEGTAFRGWYGPGARERLDAFLREVGRRYGVPVVDGRSWLADSDFFDGHHVLKSGAQAFTLRLGREVLEPFVADRLPPGFMPGCGPGGPTRPGSTRKRRVLTFDKRRG